MKDSIAQIKTWLFPSIITILAAIIWNDVKEIKNDVKSLMAQSNIDKTRINNLERLIYKTVPISNIPNNNKKSEHLTVFAIIPKNKEMDNSIQIKKKML